MRGLIANVVPNVEEITRIEWWVEIMCFITRGIGEDTARRVAPVLTDIDENSPQIGKYLVQTLNAVKQERQNKEDNFCQQGRKGIIYSGITHESFLCQYNL